MNTAKQLEAYCYIQEQTSFPEDYKKNFGYTVTDKGNRFYVEFDAILQSFDVLNRNGRYYDLMNVRSCIENDEVIQTFLKNNSWVGEIDHPAPEFEGQKLSVARIGTPDLKKSSHYIRSPKFNGNLLEAHIQTDSSNKHGMNMAIKIVDGKIIPCFSARVLGVLENKMGRPTVNVRRLITYDWVLYPSHREASAKITQPIQESTASEFEIYTNNKIIKFEELAKMAANNSKEVEWLCESFGLSIDNVTGLTVNSDIIIQEGSNVYVQPISDKQLRNKTKNMLNDWMKR